MAIDKEKLDYYEEERANLEYELWQVNNKIEELKKGHK